MSVGRSSWCRGVAGGGDRSVWWKASDPVVGSGSVSVGNRFTPSQSGNDDKIVAFECFSAVCGLHGVFGRSGRRFSLLNGNFIALLTI